MQNLSNKIDVMETFIHDFSLDILCLCEHWLTNEGLSSGSFSGLLNLSCATAFCRTQYSHGGVSIYLKDSLKYKIIDTQAFCIEKYCEIVAVHLLDFNLKVVSYYRTPTDVQEDIRKSFSILENCLTYLSSFGGTILLCGDHNVDTLKNDQKSRMFLDMLRSVNLYPSLQEPTRGKACLLNIMTDLRPENFTIKIAAGVADHDGIVFCHQTSLDSGNLDYSYCLSRDITEEQLTLFKNILSKMDWEENPEIISSRNPDIAFTAFFNKFLAIFNNCFPESYKKIKNKQLKHKQGILKNWYTAELAQIKSILLLYHDLSRGPSNADFYHLQHNRLKKIYRNKIREAKRIAYSDFIEQSPNKCRAAWSVIRDFKSTPMSQNITNTPEEFNSYFLDSVAGVVDKLPIRQEDGLDLLMHGSTGAFPVDFEWVASTTEQLISIVGGFKESDSRDFYGMSTKLLKSIFKEIADPFCSLLNACLAEGMFPDCLKIAKITPIYKKGDRSLVSSYRPISVLPILSKIFEAVMHRQLTEFFMANNLLTKSQFGFRKGLSTSHAVKSLTDTIYGAFESKESTLAILCDISKAFDSVDHSLLMKKLNFYGVRGSSLKMISGYFQSRKQVVAVNGVKSSPRDITYGVPQGSILGPFLFIILMNDLEWSMPCTTILFADDTTLASRHSDVAELQALSQESWECASDWFASNKLALNEAKTQKITFSLRDVKSENEVVKLLGFNLDQKLTWESHVNSMCTRLSRVVFLLGRLYWYVPSSYLRNAYYAFANSHLEYGTLLWGHASSVPRLLTVQKRLIRTISGAGNIDHCKPLFKNWKIMTIINLYIFKALTATKQNFNSSNLRSGTHHYNTRHAIDLDIPFRRLSKVKNCFPATGYKFYNALHISVRSLSRNKFQMVLHRWLIDNPFYNIEEYMEEAKNLIV